MKGIVLAGGTGSRLYPITQGLSKQLLPIYDKPMIFYPISVLMLAGIRDILIITSPQDLSSFKRLLGSGESYGVQFTYKIQDHAAGIAEAFIIGEEFIGEDSVCLVLGDNIFYGQGFTPKLKEVKSRSTGATIFAYYVKDPERFGVVTFNEQMKATTLEEKPRYPRSNYAVTGLYFYDNKVVEYANRIQPSKRGELEITSINQIYLETNQLQVELMGRGFAWLDTGTYESLLEAALFVQTIEHRQGLKIACLEEIAYLNGWLSENQLKEIATKLNKNNYGDYLLGLLNFKTKELM